SQIKRYTPKAQGLFDITPSDVGRPLEHFTNKLDYAGLHEDAQHVLNALQPIEREVRSADGLWFLARLTPYRTMDDKIDGVVLTFVDITNRKRSEEQLELQTAELREQAEILKLAYVIVLDAEWRILVWNSACEKIYGYMSGEAVGKIVHELLHTEFPCPREEIEEQLERTGQWEGELGHRRKDGTRLIVLSQLILHRRQPNCPPVILEVNSDITARRVAEEAAREADRNKDLFLATLAHELRNPLAAMASGVGILQRRDHDQRAIAQAAGIFERQLEHLSRIVEDLLEVERLTRGRIALRKSRTDVKKIVQAALESCKKIIDASKHRLNISTPNEPTIIEGDPIRLTQILSNLLDNAYKYTPQGGTIDLIAERNGPEIVFRVRDSGIGISAEALPHVFDTYYQAQPSTGSELIGLGIGLALVRQLTEMHAGKVIVESGGLGKGSEFIVRLPIAESPPADEVASPKPIEVNVDGPKRKVLIVDDNRDASDAMALLLEADGHTVRTALDGVSALQIAQEFAPEAAILDIGLPGMDGFELARRIREASPGVVLIALSGWRVDPNDARVRDAGFHFIFTKPIGPDELLKLPTLQSPSNSE
ncbi:MAG: response regulator, partial [Deltaproteobacteria bacterium]|nr:response regulator [Deltaproteobacteria bacterium]